MHYTGTIWRPPYEAWSALLQVTAGCTHHACKFCTLYDDIPFKFRLSPAEEIEADLRELRRLTPDVTRLFLTGANPFVLSPEKLRGIAYTAKQHLQRLRTIGCFARITDITPKTDEELRHLRSCGYTGLTIGVETGDDEALAFMRKGYAAADILTQCRRLDEAGIEYNVFYLTGICGTGNGARAVKNTLSVLNRLSPKIIGASMLTVQPTSELYAEIQHGNWTEAGETEKYEELKLLIQGLTIRTHFAALGASNAVQLHGNLPADRAALLSAIDGLLAHHDEAALRHYRTNLKHL
ncbi:MAG: radical SAM protein [Treponemataceae bacterium]|nr:radical SAM protein [Treponemataceae bacterium]